LISIISIGQYYSVLISIISIVGIISIISITQYYQYYQYWSVLASIGQYWYLL